MRKHYLRFGHREHDNMICELCGKEAGETRPTSIEGTQLRLCKECQKFGDKKSAAGKESPTKIVIASRLEQRERRMRTRDVYQEEDSWELVDDYADRIRKGREAKGWKQDALAAKINEKHNVISRVESGSLKPTDDLVRKLEKALSIELMGKVPLIKPEGKTAGKSLTLGDLIKKK
jgi:putative transcription factor